MIFKLEGDVLKFESALESLKEDHASLIKFKRYISCS